MPFNNLNDVLEQINQPFGFLLNKGFTVICSDFPDHFDNFAVGLATPDFRVRFTRDRSTITIQVGPEDAEGCWSGDLWYDLIVVTMFLTDKKILISGYWEDRYNPEKQLKRLAEVFRYYNESIIQLFKPDNFRIRRESLGLLNHEIVSLLFDPRRKSERQKMEKQANLFLQWKNKRA